MPAGPPGAPLSVLVACWVTPGLRVALLEGSTGSTCARPPVPGTMRWAVGLCSEAGAQGACGCTAWLPFETHSPACPLPPRWTWGFLLPCLCYDLEDGAVSESKPAWVSFLGEGVDFSGDSGSLSASRDQVPNIVFKFWGDEGDTFQSPQVSRI